MAFPKTVIGLYFEAFRQKSFGITLFILMRVFVSATSYVLPAVAVKYLVGALESGKNVTLVLSLLISWMVLYNVCEQARFFVLKRSEPFIHKFLHIRLYKYLVNKPFAFFKMFSSGYVASQVEHILAGCWGLIFAFPGYFLAVFVGLVLNFGLLFELNWIFGSVIGFAMLFRVVYGVLYIPKLSRAYVRVAQSKSVISGRNVDILSNVLNLKIYGDKQQEEQYLGRYYDDFVIAKKDRIMKQLGFFNVPLMLEYVVLACLMVLLSKMFFDGQVTLAEVAFVLTAFFNLRKCVSDAVWEFPDFLELFFSARQAFELLTTDVAKEGCVQYGNNLCKYDEQIVFENVSFKYDDKWILKNINLSIKKGEKIGIVGTSGAGKTTLVNLLMHLYDPTKGVLKIDGVDIRCMSEQALKSLISFVPQEAMLFNRSFAENISYGVRFAVKKRIVEAAKLAQAHDFIIKTKNGYDTKVGDRGIVLSGGQRQRITIAHAILKNSPVLILDEATSALDSGTEAKIQKSLSELMKNRTTIVIAHRLSTLRKMDRIIVLHNGKIIEQGTHAKLLRMRGKYYKLWKKQSVVS